MASNDEVRQVLKKLETEVKEEQPKKKDYTKYLLEQEKPEFKSLGCGIHILPEGEEIMYFGTKVYNGLHGMDAIVCSNGKVYVNTFNKETGQGSNEIKNLGINYRYEFFDSILDYQWSNNSTNHSIKSFVYGKDAGESLSDCFEVIYNVNKEYMDYEEDIIHTSIACSMLSSYFLPVFEAKGRDFFNAEKGSGKTKQSTLYDLQMFNPLMSADISGPSYFRSIESTAASIIIDDFDAIDDEKKSAQIQIMRTGYKQGQKTVRTSESGTRVPIAFGIFNSMVINNVGGLDDVTQDRCNTYYLIKSTDKKKADKKLDTKNPKWQIQRDMNYYVALRDWKKVREIYEELEIEGVSGRDLERVAPILTIGKLVLSEKRFEELVKFELRRIREVKIVDVSEDWLFMALNIVIKKLVLSEEERIDIRLDEIVREVVPISPENRDYQRQSRAISSYLGKCFKSTPLFKAGKVHGGYVKYTFKRKNLHKFLEIRDYLGYVDPEDLKLLTPPIQSIPSIPSNQPIQSIQSKNKNTSIQKDSFYKGNSNSGETGETGEVIKGCPKETSESEINEIMEDFE